ncbi:ATP-binding protein [Streptomyces sp. C10-9-1]|uniref:ATP-binding protein n=1 Tax=Streptomyces sp. C10-9-1 TaxID=1859285 RepID=UPI00211250A4|nr:ATP-binding protein [Streptomyces sp. C10-9-1]MCQ6553436.1 ATP-binding protein [Streptomyces sp. C10-9-1]
MSSGLRPDPSGQRRRLALFGTRGVVGRCRDFTHDALDDWGWPRAAGPGAGRADGAGECSEDVLLLVSEIVTNACLHAGGPSELSLEQRGLHLRIEVADGSPELPRRRPTAGPAQPGGHGLMVLERLARRWGAERRGAGKVVWAEVLRPRP